MQSPPGFRLEPASARIAAMTTNSPPREPLQSDRQRAESLVTSLLSQRWPDARLRALESVRGDASSRRYLRARLHGGAADCPETAIVMLMEDAGVAISSDELSVFGDDGPRELPFVNVWHFLSTRTDALPEIYLVADDSAAIVLEDVGDTPLWDAVTAPGADPEAVFGRALDLLADLQASAADDGSGCYAFEQAFDERLFRWEFEHFIEYGLDPEASAGALRECRAELARLADRLAALPRVFCHRDYHAWNLHLHSSRIRVIDFQDALLAPALYDVASLLTDRITPRLIDPSLEASLITRYAQRSGVPADRAREEYNLCAFQRVLKVVGRFNFLAEVKDKPAYAGMLPDVVPTAREFAARIDGVPATRELLQSAVKAGQTREAAL